MALLWSDTFNGATIGAGLGDNYLTANGWVGAFAADAVLGLDGTGAAIYNGADVFTVTVSAIAGGTGCVQGMRVKPDVGTGSRLLFQLANGSGVQVTLYLDLTNRRVLCYRGTSGGTLLLTGPSDAWADGDTFFIEWKVTIDNATGGIEVRVGTIPIAVLVEADTQNQATATITLLGVRGELITWDDYYALDTTGSAPLNDFLGDSGSEASENGVDWDYEEAAGIASHFDMQLNARVDILLHNLYSR